MIRVRQVKVKIEENTESKIKEVVSKKLKLLPKDIHSFQIHKRSLDARKKENIYYIYEIDLATPKEEEILRKRCSNDIISIPNEEYHFKPTGIKKLKCRPIIIGSGPAGLFAAYLLAENNYSPIVIERGEPIEERVQTVEKFWKEGILNPESNVQFGEGGAGTFSDGKLNTLVKDSHFRAKKVFEIFIACGAPKEIKYIQNPHIGTDLLRTVVKNMREKIKIMGGEFRYNSCLTDIKVLDHKLTEIEINHEQKVPCNCLILAIGHSARDTFQMLYDRNVKMEAKPFAIGLRIEHPQDMINISQYGKMHTLLPPANYKLTYQTKEGRGVYSFCMCPGGFVVNASSEKGHLVINGMSNHSRDGDNANSALVVTVSPKDFGSHALAGMFYQRDLEAKAYQVGNGKIPIQLLEDFKKNRTTTKIGGVHPESRGDFIFANLNEILPLEICKSILEAMPVFGKKIKGYDRKDAVLSGIESRTSSPIRIVRDNQYKSSIEGIFPCGEGAGYAGGITTAAIDGIKIAESIAMIYSSFKQEG